MSGMRMATAESLPQRSTKGDKYYLSLLFGGAFDRRFFFIGIRGESHTVVSGGRSMTPSVTVRLSFPL
jgi:hypothetical protein